MKTWAIYFLLIIVIVFSILQRVLCVSIHKALLYKQILIYYWIVSSFIIVKAFNAAGKPM